MVAVRATCGRIGPTGLSAFFLAALCVLAFWTRVQFIVLYGGLEDYLPWSLQNYLGGITPGYLRLADELLAGHYSSLAYPPGYPAILAFFKLIGIENLQAMRHAQAALDCAGVVLVYHLLRRVGMAITWGLSGAAAYAIYPLFAGGSTFLLGEFATPVLVLSLMALLLYVGDAARIGGTFPVGVAIGLAGLIRPDLLLLVGVACLWVLVRRWNRKPVPAILLLLLGFALPIGSWGLHNKLVHGHWVFTSTSGGVGLWEGLGSIPNPYGYVLSDEKTIKFLAERGLQWHSVEADRFLREDYLRAWRDHPEFVLRVIGKRWNDVVFVSEQFAPELSHLERIRIYFSSYGVFLVLVAAVLWRRNPNAVLILILPVGYALLSIGMVHFEPRYVRYVHLSYFFSAIMIAAWIVGRLEEHWPRIATVSTVAAMSVIGLGAAHAAVQLERSATSTRLSVEVSERARQGLLLPGYELESLDFRPAEPGVGFELANGALEIDTSAHPYAYQVVASIPAAGQKALHLTFAGNIRNGGVTFGVLSGDGARFYGQRVVSGPGDFAGALSVGFPSEDSIHLVISNNNAQGKSHISISTLDLRCYPGPCPALAIR